MKLRDEKCDAEMKQLKLVYKTCKDKLTEIGKVEEETSDPLALLDVHYQRGLYEGQLKSTAQTLNFFQDYKALPLEADYVCEAEDKLTQRQYDHLIQLIYHHLSSYVFELSAERKGDAVHREDIRNAALVIENLIEVLAIMDTGNTYHFFDGRTANWAGIYKKECHEKAEAEIILKLNIL